ncbi:MAG: helicase-associated domain-containing protein [Blastocatellia bacterium]
MSRLTIYSTLDEYERRLPEFAERLSGLSADKLKKMARIWIGKEAYKLNKESAIQTLKRCFSDRSAVRRLAENLTAAERDGLMLMKLRERRVVFTEELALELLLLHPLALDRRHPYHYYNAKHFTRLNEMLDRGLLMRCDGRGNALDGHYYPCEAVGLVADVFDEIAIGPPPALPLKPVIAAASPVARRPGELLLQATAFHQALDRLGGLQLNAKGGYTTPSFARLSKLLNWPEQEEGPTPLPNAVEFYLKLFIAADLLRVNYAAREIAPNPQINIRAALEQPVNAQARLWARAYRSLRSWKESETGRSYYYDESAMGQTKYNGLRAALLLALGMLPDPQAWYRSVDLSEVIHQRIGRHFALGYLHTYSPPWKAAPEQEAEALAKYESENHANWRKTEQVWIERALTGPLFHLGLVELAREPQDQSEKLTLFRLTEAGRAALHDIFKPGRQPVEKGRAASQAALAEQPCWIVQPNFEVVVYLDHATPRQLGFIERIGLRQKADAAIAAYRLTRESIYAALEEGVEARQLLQTLEAGSQHPLPPGVARTLGDWAARRERLALRLDAGVIEFPDAAARDAALTAGKVKGASVGDRFILTEQSEAALKRALPLGGTISYEPQPPRSLVVNADGTALITPAQHDLLIAGELSAYAEAANPPLIWRITRASVSAARARGWTADDIINRISRRSVVPPPAFLQYAIHAWCGNKTVPGPAAMTTPPLLQTSTAEEAEAICKSSFLRPHLLARIGACAVLVKPDSVKELRKLLGEYGFELGKEVLLPAPAPSEKKK